MKGYQTDLIIIAAVFTGLTEAAAEDGEPTKPDIQLIPGPLYMTTKISPLSNFWRNQITQTIA